MQHATPCRQFKGVWIPVEIWDNRDLSWMQKCLLAEINSLDDGDGCFASNEYLAKQFDSTSGSIADMISRCRAAGFIEDKGFTGRRRYISVKFPTEKSLQSRLNPSVQTEPSLQSRLNPPFSPHLTPIQEVLGEVLVEREGGKALSAAADAPLSKDEVIAYWNSKDRLPQVRVCVNGRAKKLGKRLSEPFWSANWRAAIDKIAGSDFCTGKNDRGWKADFDFLLQPDAIAKIMEGRYDNRNAAALSSEGSNLPSADEWAAELNAKGAR